MSRDDEPADLEVEAVDVEDLIRSERVRAIFGARKRCDEIRTKAKMPSGGRETEEGNTAYRSVLESYVRECEALFSQTEKGRAYWTNHKFGTVAVAPRVEVAPGDTSALRIAGTDDYIPERPEPKQVEFAGLKSLFDTGSPITIQMEVPVKSKRRGGGLTKKAIPVEQPIPFDVLDEMYAVTNGYLNDLGLGIDIQQRGKQTKIDDDLIREVEKWRRENL